MFSARQQARLCNLLPTGISSRMEGCRDRVTNTCSDKKVCHGNNFFCVYTSADMTYGITRPVHFECKCCLLFGQTRRRNIFHPREKMKQLFLPENIQETKKSKRNENKSMRASSHLTKTPVNHHCTLLKFGKIKKILKNCDENV